jgi:predicted  nucleic acid-binding Zn-ribbon protein
MLEVKDHTELYITLTEKGPFVIDAPDILKNKISI